MKNAEDKRSQIISAATKLFHDTHNVKRVSIEAIAREAHVSPTTIYNQFGAREYLVNEVIKGLFDEILGQSRALIRSDIPFPQKLIGITSGKMDVLANTSNEILQKIVSQDATMVPFLDRIYEQETKPLWREMVADGKRQGYIDKKLDADSLIIYLDVMKTGFSAKPELMRYLTGNLELLKNLTRIMFFGFLKKDIDIFPKGDRSTHA